METLRVVCRVCRWYTSRVPNVDRDRLFGDCPKCGGEMVRVSAKQRGTTDGSRRRVAR